jgi:hypothetical protein
MEMTRLSILIPALIALLLLSCSEDNPVDSGQSGNGSGDDYVVLAWNDLGMHCLNPTYDKAVILPPYNTLYAQVVKRGNPPEIVTANLSVEYRIENNTYSYGKRDYGQFWDNAVDLFGPLLGLTNLERDVGLTGKGLSGDMDSKGDHFVAEGIPVVPVDDSGQWDPYQVAVITVKDAQNRMLAQTRTTIPTSDEMNCARCHGPDADQNILEAHDLEEHTHLVDSIPFLCAECHGSPGLGTTGPGSSGIYLSKAVHGHHATTDATCYDCHPGEVTNCSRSNAHSTADGNCTTCHGTLADVANSIPDQRIPWVDEPKCANCHTGVADVNTGTTLYRNARGHGSLYCIACHGSPHAQIPAREPSDNYQALQYQDFTGRVKSLGSCGVCHASSRGEEEDIHEFAEKHGGFDPERVTGCNICHTAVPSTRALWPHSYQWTNSN